MGPVRWAHIWNGRQGFSVATQNQCEAGPLHYPSAHALAVLCVSGLIGIRRYAKLHSGRWASLAGQACSRKGRTGPCFFLFLGHCCAPCRCWKENAKWFEERLTTVCQKLGPRLRIRSFPCSSPQLLLWPCLNFCGGLRVLKAGS